MYVYKVNIEYATWENPKPATKPTLLYLLRII